MIKDEETWEEQEKISRRFRALLGWYTRRRNKREEQIDRWRVVKRMTDRP